MTVRTGGRPCGTVATAVAATAIMALLAGCSSEPVSAPTTATAVMATPPAGAGPAAAPPVVVDRSAPTTPPHSSVPLRSTGAPSLAPTTTTVAPRPKPVVTRSLPRNQISIDGQQVARSTAAAAAATRYMQAFARPDLSKQAWWARIAPLLTPEGQQAVYGVDPARIPVTTVTGKAVVLPNAEKDARMVTVPTDIGDYTLFLRWDATGSQWLVRTAQPPDGTK